MKYAIVESSGSQLRVEEGMTVEVDRLSEPVGAEVRLPVILLADGGSVQIGNPLVKGLAISARVVEHSRRAKIRVFKYKAKTRYRRRHGHRQQVTKLTIDKIGESVGSEQAISELKLGARSERALVKAGISSIDDIKKILQSSGDKALLDVPGFGAKGLSDLKASLDALGIEVTVDE